MFYVYIWKTADGTPFYVGKGTGRRAGQVSRRTADFIAVHSRGGCTVEIVDEFILESQAHVLEMDLIARYGRREFGGLLVNKTDGGEGSSGFRHDAHTIEMLRRMKVGKVDAPWIREKKSAWQRGRSLSEAHRASLSLAHLNRSDKHAAGIAAANLMRAPLPGRFKGVRCRNGKWSARIAINGKRRQLGTFATAIDAALAYDAAARAAWSDGCFLNFGQEENAMNAHGAAFAEANIDTPLGSQMSPFDYLMRTPPANDNGIVEHPRIIGLIGYAGSGKSTVASILRQECGFTHTKFAGPLKSMLRELYRQAGLSEMSIERRIEGDLKEVPDDLLQGRSPRQAMQWLGTDWGRNFFGPDFWVGMWAASIDTAKRYVVDDCRFPNEADAIRARGGIIVLVERPGYGPVNDHVSEDLPTDPDVVLHNNGPIHDLRSRVAEIAA